MFDVQKYLQKNEKILLQNTPVLFGCIPGLFFFGLFFLGFFIFMYWLLNHLASIQISLLIIIPLILFLFIAIITIFNVKARRQVLTNKRLFVRSGILTESFKGVYFKYVTSIYVRQGIFGRMFNYGTIVIDTSGTGMATALTWIFVKDPIQAKNAIEKHIK